MADHALHLRVHQFLRDDGCGLGVGLVVFAHEFEAYFLATDREPLGVDFFERQACAVVVIPSQMRLRAGERRDRADFYNHFSTGGGCGGRFLFTGREARDQHG